MQIYATAENLQIVQNAITELVQGEKAGKSGVRDREWLQEQC